MRGSTPPLPTIALALLAAGCGRATPAPGDGAALGPGAARVVPEASAAPPASATPRRAKDAGASRAALGIPAGKLVAGSLPGDEGRDPKVEPMAYDVELGPFEIDRLPYPGDANAPPRTSVSRDDAARLCAERGARLCTELEWERACKGPDGAEWATGAAWDASCADRGAGCASGFGVEAMGTLREWTASAIATDDDEASARPVVRGARPDADARDRRCAHRASLDPGASSPELGFRCCKGAPNAAAIPRIRAGQAFRRVELDPKQLGEMLGAVPQLARLKDGVRLFSEPDDVNAVRKRGNDAPLDGFTLTTSPIVWNPVGADEVLVVAGRARKDSFVAAFHRLPGDRYRVASSMIFADDPGPFVLGFAGYVRDKLLWSSCWKCSGEGGAVTLREGRRVVVVQQ